MNIINNPYTLSIMVSAEKKFLIFGMLIVLMTGCKRGDNNDFTVMTGSFRQSITEGGELEAVKASFITMPRIGWQYGYQFKIIDLTEHGKTIHKNDSIIKLDPSSIYKFILEKEDVLENELAASKKQIVQSENNIQELKAQLKSELAAYDLKKLEVERSKFDTDVKKRIKMLEFEQATIKLNKVKRNLEQKPLQDEYDSHIQKIKVEQCETDLKNAKETLNLLAIKSPLEGIFQVAVNRFSSNPQIWKIGDSPYQGQIIASIPDISKMQAKTYINEADFLKIKTGMKSIVRLDALPSVPFEGVVTYISKICMTREQEKVFAVTVEINDTDLRLKPGMTVNCEFIIIESDEEKFVPNNCLLKQNGHSYIFLKKRGAARKIEVQSGASNSNHTIIKSDIRSGQRLVPINETSESKKI